MKTKVKYVGISIQELFLSRPLVRGFASLSLLFSMRQAAFLNENYESNFAAHSTKRLLPFGVIRLSSSGGTIKAAENWKCDC